MSVVDPRGSSHVLDLLYSARMPSIVTAPNVVMIPVTYTLLLPRCAGCGRPMRPEQNARQIAIGWVCMACYLAKEPLSLVIVQPLPRLAWWRRALAWFVASTLPEARARER